MGPLLGVNIDHVATLRQARGESFPDPVAAALEAVQGGAQGITAHLREDRRHIQDQDILKLKAALSVPLNMEMAATPELAAIAEKAKPAWVCLVPEKRKELTTEGGLDVLARQAEIKKTVQILHGAGIQISFFVEPVDAMVKASKEAGADAIEIHTGLYAKTFKTDPSAAQKELRRIAAAAETARQWGLLVNAGHGIDYENVGALSKIFVFHEFNIGFAIIGRSIFVGLKQAVKEMKEKIQLECAVS